MIEEPMPDVIWADFDTYGSTFSSERQWGNSEYTGSVKYIRADKYANNLISETKALRDHCDYLEDELNKSSEKSKILLEALEKCEWYITTSTFYEHEISPIVKRAIAIYKGEKNV